MGGILSLLYTTREVPTFIPYSMALDKMKKTELDNLVRHLATIRNFAKCHGTKWDEIEKSINHIQNFQETYHEKYYHMWVELFSTDIFSKDYKDAFQLKLMGSDATLRLEELSIYYESKNYTPSVPQLIFDM